MAFLALILFAVGATLAFRSSFNISNQRRIRQSLEARYLAHSGLQRTLNRLRHGQKAGSESFEYGGGQVAIKYSPGTGPFGEPLTDIIARGTFQGLGVTLLAKAEVDPSLMKAASESPSEATTVSEPAMSVSTDEALAEEGTASSDGGLHVAALKYVVTLHEDSKAVADPAEANRLFQDRLQKANRRYVDGLAHLSRAELRWRLYKLARTVAAADDVPASLAGEPAADDELTNRGR